MCLYSWDYTSNHDENEDGNENRSHRYNIKKSKSRHGHRYSKYKKCLSMIKILCIKQYLSSIWTSIHEKVK